MKRIFVLAFLLALVAIMAVPMAAFAADTAVVTTSVGGAVSAASISMVAPGAISGMALVYTPEFTPIDKAGTNGSVTMTAGTAGLIGWQVVADAVSPGKLAFAGTPVANQLLLGKTVDTPDWRWATGTGTATIHGQTVPASGKLTYTGSTSPGTIAFRARQYVESTDGDLLAGTYAITITFTATITV
jgi:hypothetical protein